MDEVLYNPDSFLAQDVIITQESPIQWPFPSSIKFVEMVIFSRLDKANIVEVHIGFCIWNCRGTLGCSGLVGAFEFLGIFQNLGTLEWGEWEGLREEFTDRGIGFFVSENMLIFRRLLTSAFGN